MRAHSREPSDEQQRWRRPHALAALLAVAAISLALWRLFDAESGLDIAHLVVDGVPVTVFTPRDSQPVTDAFSTLDPDLDPNSAPASAPVIVIGHGFAGSRQLMHPFALTLASNGYVSVVFDFPGHGRNRNRLAGELGEPERTGALLDSFAGVMAFARALPQGDGRVATLGHSMAGDIMVHYAERDPSVDAGVAVSPYLSRALGAELPRNLLFIYGDLEPEMIMQQGRAALAVVAGLPAADIAPDVTYGSMTDGTARRMVVAPGVEHIGVLYSRVSQQAALDWLNAVYGRQSSGVIDARGPWLAAFYLGVMLLAWPLARLLPVVTAQPVGANLRWRRLLPLAVAPALLTPLILWPLPSDFLPIVIGDYIALHFGLYGLLTLIGLWLVGERPASLWHRVAPGAFALAVLAVFVFETLAVTLPTDRFVASFLPATDRWPTALALLAGTLIWAIADEWLTRGAAAPRGAYALTKSLFVLSLMLAVVLNLNELFFLVIIIPAILALFVIYGLFSGWIYRRTKHPAVAALTNALVFASAIAVSFPMLANP
jgi:dienelactone hydrolase